MTTPIRTLRRLLAVAAAAAFASTSALASQIDTSALTDDGQYHRFIVTFEDGSVEAASPERVAAALSGAADRIAPLQGRASLRVEHLRRLSVGADLVGLDRRLDRDAAEALMHELAGVPGVALVEVDQLLTPALVPNDPRYSEQWHYYEAAGGINLPQAWDITTGAGVVMGIIDTGSTPHPDLSGNTLPGYDFISDASIARDGNGRDGNPNDEGDWTAANECRAGAPASSSSWHGTHVAGTAGAIGNNGTGGVGVAFGARLVHARVLGRCGGYASDIIDAITWTSGGNVPGVPANANPAEVINLSLGGGGGCSGSYQSAINGAVSRGTTVVVAAGNSNANASGSVPANCQNVIAVAATTRQGARASFSNYGAVVDIAAPGQGILSTLNTGSTTQGSPAYASYNGTSMAAPHVAGVVALMQAAAPTPLSPAQVESIIKSTARAFPSPPSQPIGAGIVDAFAAVQAASGGGSSPPPGGNVLQRGVPVTGLSGAAGSQRYWTIQVPAGVSTLTVATSSGSGDVDLYVRRGAPPTTSSYHCRPYRNGNNETCTFSSPASGTWHVMLRGFRAYSGVRLVATY